MKFLVEEATSLVKGGYEPPLPFSISGHFVVDVDSALQVVPPSNALNDLVSAKVAAYQAVHPLLNLSVYDELLDTSKVELTGTLSTRYLAGDGKRTAMLPNGRVTTTSLTVPGGTFSRYFLHFSLFTISRPSTSSAVRPGPVQVLYNANLSPDPSLVRVDLLNTAGTLVQSNLRIDGEDLLSVSGGFRLQFTNLSSTQTLYLSDWLLLCAA